jgi:hypothetical protein
MEHARRPNGRVYWAALVVAVALTIGGAALAYFAYQRNTSPAGVVGDYFTALQHGDAPAALALGDVPHGSRALLTNTVLEQQQRIAPLGDVSVGPASNGADRESVRVDYTLNFPGQPLPVTTTVAVHRTGDGWRLDRAAVATQLMLAQAGDRATVGGARVPPGSVLLFPGAAPLAFDTPYLQEMPSSAGIDFQTGPTIEVSAEVSPAGKVRATSLVRAALQDCLRGQGAPGCPLPEGQYVPGTVHGTLDSKSPQLTVDVGAGVTGTIEVTGQVGATATYRRLDFRNRSVSGEGTVQLTVRAESYATDPMNFVWEQT